MDLPVNALVSRKLRKNVAYESGVGGLQNITLPFQLFSKLISTLDDDLSREIANEGTIMAKKVLAVRGASYTLEEMIEHYFLPLSKYCGWFEFSFVLSENCVRLVFESNLGPTWTHFISNHIGSVLKSLDTFVENERSDGNMLIYKVRIPQVASTYGMRPRNILV